MTKIIISLEKKEHFRIAREIQDYVDGWKINHIAIAIECLKPKLSNHLEAMKQSISNICKINTSDIGITATTGENLTAFGKGKGIQAITIITVSKL